MRVCDHGTVAGKMFRHSRHAGAAQPACESARQLADSIRFAMERSVANDFANAPVEVDAGSETQVDPHSPEFRRDYPPRLPRDFKARLAVLIVFAAYTPHRRHICKSIAKALHSTTLMIDRNQHGRAAQRTNLRDKSGYLFGRLKISRK
jgi:hypothetical protein